MRVSRGFRAGTRSKLRLRPRDKFTVEKILKEFKPETRVMIKLDPQSHDGMPHPKYKGKTGIIKGRRGSSYIISVKIGKKEKQVISRPEHLEAAK